LVFQGFTGFDGAKIVVIGIFSQVTLLVVSLLVFDFSVGIICTFSYFISLEINIIYRSIEPNRTANVDDL
jgi:hypothetical protein